MTQKADRAAALLKRIPKEWKAPKPLKDASLFEQGLLCVLTRHLNRTQAETTIKNLREAFPDWNELRVSQVQEVVPHVATKGGNGASLVVARDVKEFLQEVFQKNHGFDLEFLREDLAEASKFLAGLPFLGAAASHFLLWLASGEELPASPGLVRTLDRLGLVGRTSSMKKARVAIQPIVPKGRELEFAVAFGTVVERWCDAKKPICWECPLVGECPHGKKVHRDWKLQQERLEAQRQREAARAEAQRQKEEAKQKREEERRRREAEKLARKLERERARREKAKEKEKREAERKREREKQEAQRKKAAQKKKAAKKTGSTSKKAKKPAKKTTAKKATAKKPAKKPAKKTTTKSSSKSSSKKGTGGKKTGGSGSAKKPTTGSKKKTSRKTGGGSSSQKKGSTSSAKSRKKDTTRRKTGPKKR